MEAAPVTVFAFALARVAPAIAGRSLAGAVIAIAGAFVIMGFAERAR